MSQQGKQEQTMPPQEQDQQPGIESEMTPRPVAEDAQYKGSGKLKNKVALITGSGQGLITKLHITDPAQQPLRQLDLPHGDFFQLTREVDRGRRHASGDGHSHRPVCFLQNADVEHRAILTADDAVLACNIGRELCSTERVEVNDVFAEVLHAFSAGEDHGLFFLG